MPEVRKMKDLSFLILSILIGGSLLAVMFSTVFEVFYRGARALISSGISFFLHNPYQDPPGILPSLIGSLEISGISLAISSPIALGCSLLASEFPDSKISTTIKALSGTFLQIPTIVVGIFIYSLLVIRMGHFSLLAGSLALSIVILPYLTSYFSSSLSSVPAKYKEAAYSVGMSKAKASVAVSMRIAKRGLLSGALISFSKAIGETAPLMFTIGGARGFVPPSPMYPGDALPLLIYVYAQQPYPQAIMLAWGASAVLLLLLFSITFLGRVLVKEVRI